MSRDFSKSKFSFQAFRNLKKGLGEFDAVVECNELAIREFLNNLIKAPDQNKYIQNLSEKHQVRVDTVRVELFAPRIRLFYILSVMQKAEQFFDELKKEYKAYYPNWTSKADGDTDLDTVLVNLFSSKNVGIQEIGEEIYYGIEYYRFVRNRFAHSEEKNEKRLNMHFKKVKSYSSYYNLNFHNNSAPNDYKEIDFSDFLLVTNLIKNIGYTISEKCKPDNRLLAEMLSKKEIKVSNDKTINAVKSIYKLKNNKKRFANSFENLLNSYFGRLNEEDRNEILSYLNPF